MKVAIVSQGRSHLINLARELLKNKEFDVTFYTMMPTFRCKRFGYEGKVVSCFFPVGIIYLLIEKVPFLNPYRRNDLRSSLKKIFDCCISTLLRRCDVLIGLNGTAIVSSKKAQKKFNAITICDQGSSHILTQDAVRASYSIIPTQRSNTENLLRHYDVADFLMAPSVYVMKTDIDNGVEKERVLYNPYGVDLETFQPTINPMNDSYDVIMVGSWWKHKGCDMLAEACINRLKLKLLHVGSVVDCPLPDSALFKHIDFVPENELPLYYAEAKIFAVSSLDEGLALVQLQAAACGLPVVGSTRSGVIDLADLLGHPKGCVTIEEPLSVDTITIALQRALLWADTLPGGPRLQYGSKISNISWSAYAKRYSKILKQLIDNRNG